MENKYNVGEPVAIYAWVDGISHKDGKVVYSLKVEQMNDYAGHEFIDLVPEDSLGTVF